jgi:hypothetical protein
MRGARAESTTLLDCGATENFVYVDYARRMKLPVKMLEQPRKIINVDGTANTQGDITHYTDISVQHRVTRVLLRFLNLYYSIL